MNVLPLEIKRIIFQFLTKGCEAWVKREYNKNLEYLHVSKEWFEELISLIYINQYPQVSLLSHWYYNKDKIDIKRYKRYYAPHCQTLDIAHGIDPQILMAGLNEGVQYSNLRELIISCETDPIFIEKLAGKNLKLVKLIDEAFQDVNHLNLLKLLENNLSKCSEELTIHGRIPIEVYFEYSRTRTNLPIVSIDLYTEQSAGLIRTSELLQTIHNFPKLEGLTLFSCVNLTGIPQTALEALSKLKSFHAMSEPFEDDSQPERTAVLISKMTSLEQLFLNLSDDPEECIQFFTALVEETNVGFPRLQNVEFESRLDGQTADRFVNLFSQFGKSCPVLKTLNLSRFLWSRVDMTPGQMSTFLQEFPNLEELRLHESVRMGSDDTAVLVIIASQCRELKILSMRDSIHIDHPVEIIMDGAVNIAQRLLGDDVPMYPKLLALSGKLLGKYIEGITTGICLKEFVAKHFPLCSFKELICFHCGDERPPVRNPMGQLEHRDSG